MIDDCSLLSELRGRFSVLDGRLRNPSALRARHWKHDLWESGSALTDI